MRLARTLLPETLRLTRPWGRLHPGVRMMSKEKVVWLALTLTALMGCGSPCSGEFIGEDEACSPGCGVRVLYNPGCVDAVFENWCVRPSNNDTSEDVRCIIDEETGRIYDQTRHPERSDVPANVRYCTAAESQSRYECAP